MPISELEKFREKYPQYNDLDDITIANKLAEKYPKAYGDLPQKVGISEQPQEQPQQETIPQMLGKNISEAYKESFGVIPSAVSDLLLGYPKAIAKKYFPQQVEAVFPEQKTLAGKTGRIATNIILPLAGVSKLARAGTVGLRHGARFIPALRNLTTRQILSGATTGGVIGGLYTEDLDKTLPERAVGAGLGALAGGMIGTIPTLTRGYRKLKAPAKLKPTQKISLLQAKAKQTYDEPIQEARLAQQKLNWDKQDVRQTINENIRQSNLIMKQSISQIDNKITKSARTGSLSFQEELPDFFHANGRTYGNRVIEITEALINKRGVAITKGELNDIIQNSIFEVQSIGISQGQPNAYLNMLSNKYAVKENMDNLGNIITDANTSVDFKQAIYDMRSIWKTISAQAKQGKFTDNDIVAAILKKNWGRWVAKYAPELQELNTSYQSVIQAMKESARIFKPAQGEIATKQAEQFLTRLGKGKLSGGERKMLDMIEQGTEFAPGVGEISQGIKQLGTERVAIIAKQELKRAGLQKTLSDKLTKFQTQERELAQTINQNRQLLQNRLGQLGIRKEEVMKLMANRDKANRIRRNLLIGAGVATSFMIPYSIQRLLYRIRTNE